MKIFRAPSVALSVNPSVTPSVTASVTAVTPSVPSVTADEGTPRIWLSAGSEVVSERRAAEAGYLPGAVVPISAWSEPCPAERELLMCKEREEIREGRTVIVVRMPEQVMAPLRQIDGPHLTAAERAELGARAVEQLAPFLESREDLQVPGLRVQAGGLRTATTCSLPGGLAFIGLHVDRWHAGECGCLVHTQLSINLAPRDRFLVFLNLPVDELAQRFGAPVGEPADCPGSWLAIPRWFAQQHAEYPLVRVRIRPGEAYIAPTENLVHDVSLEGSPIDDVSFTVRGRFRLPG